jgi:hypothetical protein
MTAMDTDDRDRATGTNDMESDNPSFPSFGSGNACSDAASDRICLIGDGIGHNSEKQFNSARCKMPFLRESDIETCGVSEWKP